MGLDIDVMIADWFWLGEVPARKRLSRLREAWYADETGLWDWDAPEVEGCWKAPQGPNAAFFDVYEFRGTLGSFKPHLWAGERWEEVREHADPLVRAELDAMLLGLFWSGLDGEMEHVDPGFFCEKDPVLFYGVLLARSPESVRELAATWERVRPRLGELRGPFDEHAARPQGWVGSFDEFTDLLDDWGRVLAEAARRGWGMVGLSE